MSVLNSSHAQYSSDSFARGLYYHLFNRYVFILLTKCGPGPKLFLRLSKFLTFRGVYTLILAYVPANLYRESEALFSWLAIWLLFWWFYLLTEAHNCHGKTKSHGTTNFTHGKTKLTHCKTKFTQGKTKLTHDKTKFLRWPTTVTAKQKVTAPQTLFTAKQN